jgi:hypothetical protein
VKTLSPSLLAALGLWCVFAGASASAQAPAPKPGEQVGSKDAEVLRQRYRPAIHPGDAHALVGIEEGGHDLRASTPTLANGLHQPLQVDIEASYERTQAMYGDGVMFHTPLPAPVAAPPPAARPAADPVTDAPGEPEHAEPYARPTQAAPWLLFSGLLVSGLLIAWFFVRVRPALLAPKEEPIVLRDAEPFVWDPTRRTKPVFRANPEPLRPPSQKPSSPSPHPGGARMGAPRKRR